MLTTNSHKWKYTFITVCSFQAGIFLPEKKFKKMSLVLPLLKYANFWTINLTVNLTHLVGCMSLI